MYTALFPPGPTCIRCKRPVSDFLQTDWCQECWSRIPFIQKPYCFKCGRPLVTQHTDLCTSCGENELKFKLARSATVYSEEMRELIHRFKYAGDLGLGRALGRVMAQKLASYSELKGCKLIIPIPLHPETAEERSFNQALILAQEVADKRRIPIRDDLRRLPGSALQHTLSSWQRKQGMAGEFYLADATFIKGKKVLLVDDILTTGSTLSEAARVLLRGGAREVAGFTLAIGISPKDGF